MRRHKCGVVFIGAHEKPVKIPALFGFEHGEAPWKVHIPEGVAVGVVAFGEHVVARFVNDLPVVDVRVGFGKVLEIIFALKYLGNGLGGLFGVRPTVIGHPAVPIPVRDKREKPVFVRSGNRRAGVALRIENDVVFLVNGPVYIKNSEPCEKPPVVAVGELRQLLFADIDAVSFGVIVLCGGEKELYAVFKCTAVRKLNGERVVDIGFAALFDVVLFSGGDVDNVLRHFLGDEARAVAVFKKVHIAENGFNELFAALDDFLFAFRLKFRFGYGLCRGFFRVAGDKSAAYGDNEGGEHEEQNAPAGLRVEHGGKALFEHLSAAVKTGGEKERSVLPPAHCPKNSFAVFPAVIRPGGFDDRLVAGYFNIVFRLAAHEPDGGIVPVERRRQHQKEFVPKVPPFIVGELVAEDKSVFLREKLRRGKKDGGLKIPHHHGTFDETVFVKANPF